MKAVLTWFEKWIRDTFTKRNEANAQEAKARAEQAVEAAAQAGDPKEAEKWKAIAAVWREIAEKFRHENEMLQAELDSARQKAETMTDNDLRVLAMEDAFEVSNDDIRATDRLLLLENKS